MKLPKVSVVLATKTGGWLYYEAKKLGAKLINSVGDMGTQRRVLQGYVITAIKSMSGERAKVTVIDPPGRLFRGFDSGRRSSRAHPIQLRSAPRRDIFEPNSVFTPPGSDTSGWQANTAVTTSYTLSIGEELEEGIDITTTSDTVLVPWCSMTTNEMPWAIHSCMVGVADFTPVFVNTPVGAPPLGEYPRFGLSCFRAYSPFPGTVQDSPTYSGRDRTGVFLSEQAIFDKTGFGFVHRMSLRSAGSGRLLSPSAVFPQLPFAQVYRSQPEGYVVIPVCTTQPAVNPQSWQNDAGISGLLVIRIDYDPDPDDPEIERPSWGDHYLLRFDSPPSPFLQAEQWDSAWPWYPDGGDPDVDYGYPNEPVSGYTLNSITGLRVCFEETVTPSDERKVVLHAFFTASFGRQYIGAGEGERLVFEQTTLACTTVECVGRSALSATTTILDHDCICPTTEPGATLYATYGSGDPVSARTFFLQGVEQLDAGPRAIVSAHKIRRDTCRQLIPGAGFSGGPSLLSLALSGSPGSMRYEWALSGYISSAAPTSEALVYDNTSKLHTVTTGLTWEYNWPAGGSWPYAYIETTAPYGTSWVSRAFWNRVKSTTKVGSNKMLVSGFSVGNSPTPGRALFMLDADAGTFSLFKSLPYAASDGSPWSWPALTCYQQERTTEDGPVPFCGLVSYWTTLGSNDPTGAYTAATYLTVDGGTTLNILGAFSGEHGVYYAGPKIYAMRYTTIFAE